jgi:hypothetical protein
LVICSSFSCFSCSTWALCPGLCAACTARGLRLLRRDDIGKCRYTASKSLKIPALKEVLTCSNMFKHMTSQHLSTISSFDLKNLKMCKTNMYPASSSPLSTLFGVGIK